MNNIDHIDEYDALKKNLFYHSMNAAPVSKLKTHIGSALEAIESLQARIAELEGGQGEAVATIHISESETSSSYHIDPLSCLPLGSHLLYTQPPSAVPEFLLEMSKQMQAQPNRMTAHPFWQVRCKRHLPTEQGYNDCGYEIVGDDGVVYRSYDSDEEDLELLLLEDYPEFCEKWCAAMENGDSIEDAIGSFDPQQDELPDGLQLVYVQEVEEVVTTHLTESDAKWFIRRKQHDYPKLYTYVASAYWSPRFRQLQDWIIGLTATQESKP